MLVNTTQAASLLGVSPTRVRKLLKEGRIRGAYKLGKFWLIPLYEKMPIVTKGTRGPQPNRKSGRQPACSIIRINRQEVDRNYKQSKFAPVISVKKGDSNIYGHEVEVNGPCRIVYSPNQTKFGARVWIETFSKVDVFRKDYLLIEDAS
jgi:excisionase family DNA binding protein